MTGDAATLAFYQTNAARYGFNSAQGHSRHLDRFLDRLPICASVLELGCGTGRDAARMIKRGFRVDATDGAAAMVRKAWERHGVEGRVLRFDELDADAAYHAVWANACLLHVPRTDLPAVLAAIHRALRPGGWHGASYKLGEGEARDGLGRLHNFPSREWLERTYAAAGFQLHDSFLFKAQGSDGVARDWAALMVQKAA